MCVMVQIYLNICKENKNFHSFHYWNKGNVYWQSHQSQNIRIDTDKQTANIYRRTTHIYSKQHTQSKRTPGIQTVHRQGMNTNSTQTQADSAQTKQKPAISTQMNSTLTAFCQHTAHI